MTKALKTLSLAVGAFAMTATAIPAHAQLGGIMRDAMSGAQSNETAEGCEKGETRSTGSRVLGGILGGAARRTAGRAGLGSFVPVAEFTDTLVAEIACQLNEDEQKQAADATTLITKIEADEEGNETPPEVGRSAEWTSETREGVSGTSTITSREAESGGNDCITVTDVIIVEGEETRADKRMCRLAGSPRYTIVA